MADQEVYTGRDRKWNLTITIINPDVWKEFSELSPTFLEYCKVLFKDIVFESHRYLIRVTPMLTGRLRGGWTAILNKYNVDYAAAFMDVSLVTGHNEPLSQEAIKEGMALSQYIDEMDKMDVTIINGVEYAEYVEFGTSMMEGRYYTTKAMYKAEHIMQQAFSAWFRKMTEQQRVVLPDPIEAVAA